MTGWYGGSADQFNYEREARALADGVLPGVYWDYARGKPRPDRPPYAEVTDYAYGLGYPILGVPFMNLGLRRDPFLVPDMLAFALIVCMALLLARRFISDPAALVFAGMLAVASPLLTFTVMPWNTTITAVAVLAALLFATSERRDWKAGAMVGLALSLCYAARFSDVLWPTFIVAAGILATWRRNAKGCVRVAGVAAGMLVATYLAVGWTQYLVFGNFFTNPYHYHFHNGSRGDSLAQLHLGQVPRAFTEVFVTAKSGTEPVEEPHTSILRAFPWVVAAPLGFVILVRRRHRHLSVLTVAAMTSLVASMSYLAYWSGTGADIVHYNMRFFVPWFPLWGLLAAIGLTALVQAGTAALRSADEDERDRQFEPFGPTRAEAAPSSLGTAARSVALQSASSSRGRKTGSRQTGWITSIAAIASVAVLGTVWFANRPTTIDLMERFPKAQKRPVDAIGRTFAVKDEKIGGETIRAIYAHPPSRITWTATVPGKAQFRTFLGVDEQAWDKEGDGVVFRVGVSDGRTYEDLLIQHVDPHSEPDHRRWLPITIDLDRFAGQRLDLIFNTNTSMPGRGDDGRNDFAYWGAPAICPRPYNVIAPR